LDLHIKDLKILLESRELKDVIIVDNCSINYMLQLTNGIPMKDYNGDRKDFYLYSLCKYLKTFREVADVRDKITEDFRINDFVTACMNAQ
jgi:TFIIF-interacting CTD phosphatase-like protein